MNARSAFRTGRAVGAGSTIAVSRAVAGSVAAVRVPAVSNPPDDAWVADVVSMSALTAISAVVQVAVHAVRAMKWPPRAANPPAPR